MNLPGKITSEDQPGTLAGTPKRSWKDILKSSMLFLSVLMMGTNPLEIYRQIPHRPQPLPKDRDDFPSWKQFFLTYLEAFGVAKQIVLGEIDEPEKPLEPNPEDFFISPRGNFNSASKSSASTICYLNFPIY